MEISVLTVLPELYTTFLKTSLIGRAQGSGSIQCTVSAFRDFAIPKERIDAPTFGHGAGMLIKPEVLDRAIAQREAAGGSAYKVFFSPQGKRLTQPLVANIVRHAQRMGHLLLVAGRYEGMDARAEEYYADEVISLGDFVAMGGDLPAMLFLEAFLRLIPGVVGKQESVEKESFSGPFVDYPEYTEPLEWHGMKVPEVIRSGNHAAIDEWRQQQAAKKTVIHHFQWLRSSRMSAQEKRLASGFIPPHYCALLHTDVLIGKEGQIGTTSVTSIDIHDMARSAATYGMRGFFVVTPLVDQQKIVHTLLDFWRSEEGIAYNRSRHSALNLVELTATLDDVVVKIEGNEGKKPLVIATSARNVQGVPEISYQDQEVIWQQERPVLLIFGTGRGLSQDCLQRCDYVLSPIVGFSDFNHLSVRSAAAIVVDRWLGLQGKML